LEHRCLARVLRQKRRSGIYQNPARSEESGIEVTSKAPEEEVEPNEADRHYEYEDAIFEYYVKQAIEDREETEGTPIRRILDRGTGITIREEERLQEWRTTHTLEEKERIAYCELEKAKKLVNKKERQLLLAQAQLREWKRRCQNWETSAEWDEPENYDWFNWRRHFGLDDNYAP
jgi:hypothetical protein